MDSVEDDQFALEDSVVVNAGVTHPQLDYELTGWQGRVTEIALDDTYGTLYYVEWDSITLKQMPRPFLEEADEKGIDWTRTYLPAGALRLTLPRDSAADATRVAEELSDAYESRT